MGIISKIYKSFREALSEADTPMILNENDPVGYWDMSKPEVKTKALKEVAPLGYVLARVSSMASDGKFYVVDKNNNEVDNKDYNYIRNLLKKPNTWQDFSQFLKEVNFYLKLYGFCPLHLVRATEKSPIQYMMPLSPDKFIIKNCSDILKLSCGINEGQAYYYVDGQAIELEPHEYTILHDGIFTVENGELIFFSAINSLSDHVRNYIGQLKARGNLIINGGGKGIIHGNDTSEFGNLELTPKEKEELTRQFNAKNGLIGKSPILVTRAKVDWIPLSFNVEQLQLHQEDVACMKDISNAIGINPNLFISDSTFQNQEAVKKSAYQDVIIPDANRIAEALTSILCKDGITIKIDYSHVPCLQEDLSASALALKNMALGLKTLTELGLLSTEEARIEISKHLDINPNEQV